MEIMSSLLPPPLLLLLLSLSLSPISSSSSSSTSTQNFIHCLISHSHPSHPISPSSLHTPKNPSFSLILHSHIRNLRFNYSSTPKPFLIITPSHVTHVQVSILCAKKHSIHMTIRSGGHDYEGASYTITTNPNLNLNPLFFILDMFNLRAIDIDMNSESAWVQAGATLGEVYYKISEISGGTHGFPGGTCPTVGIGGFVSGGGYGTMMRKYGLSVDNVVDAEIVDVHGRLLDRSSMGEDLFWAIRGGGGGSFGVVLSYKLKLVPVPNIVTVFKVGKTIDEDATDIVYQWQHVAPSFTKDLYVRIILDVVKCDNLEHGTKKKTIRVTFMGLFLGDSKTLVSYLNMNFPTLGLKKSDCIETSWIGSVLFWANYDISKTAPEVLLNRFESPLLKTYLKRKSDYVKKPLSKEGLEAIWKKMIELEHVSLFFMPYGGRMAEISATAMPIPHRAGNLWKIQYKANWKEAGKEVEEKYLNLTRELHRFMTPYVSSNPRQAFYNYKDHDLGTKESFSNSNSSGTSTRVYYGEMYFGDNFERLVQIKTKVDPENFFTNEQSIPALPHIPKKNNDNHNSASEVRIHFIVLVYLLYIWLWGKFGCSSCRRKC